MGKRADSPTGTGVTISFMPGGKVTVPAGETFLAAAWRGGIPIDSPCGGQGICGRCRVLIAPPPSPSPEETAALPPREIVEGWRLSCRARAATDARVTLPAGRTRAVAVPPLPGIGRGRLAVPHRRRPAGGVGAALDIGTTTLAAQLWSLEEPRLIETATVPNPQAPFGADVISRISASTGATGLPTLRDVLRRGIEDLLSAMLLRHGLAGKDLVRIVVAGNTVMQHFLTGHDPSPLASAPFRPAFLRHPARRARNLGMVSLGGAVVSFLPCISAFVGGDAVAGLVTLSAMGRKAPALFIDMGTNAEVVLIRSRSHLATSAAAGPALEGGSISSGRAAVAGAVEEVRFDGDLRLRVLGGLGPQGLCGSGLIDLASLLLEYGLLLPDGRLLSSREVSRHPWRKLASRLGTAGGEVCFTVHGAEGGAPAVTLTQDDIRQLQLAKAAIATAWQTLLRSARLEPGKVTEVFLAGGFGYSLRPESLVGLGLIHPLWKGRLSVLGNSSLTGASLCLLDTGAEERAASVARCTRTFHLAERADFRDLFIHNLSFPEHT